MILCDLCGQSKECAQKEIEGKEYDVCDECWTPLAEKLKGKGRTRKKIREMVFLPQTRPTPEPKPSPPPEEPPKIWGRAH